jgi:ribose/xylose/arabinose/galactoside ABC-type transport system permease subunit
MKIDWTRNETLVALVILAFCLLAALSDPGFLSIATLTGTVLGVALIVLVRNSLIVLGIPATWQSVTIGLLILVGTGLPAWQAKRAAARAA